MTKKKYDIKSETVYYSVTGSTFYSRKAAVEANRNHKANYIEQFVYSKIYNILKNVPILNIRPDLSNFCQYLRTANLLDTDKKIKSFRVEAALEYSKDYPNSVQS